MVSYKYRAGEYSITIAKVSWKHIRNNSYITEVKRSGEPPFFGLMRIPLDNLNVFFFLSCFLGVWGKKRYITATNCLGVWIGMIYIPLSKI